MIKRSQPKQNKDKGVCTWFQVGAVIDCHELYQPVIRHPLQALRCPLHGGRWALCRARRWGALRRRRGGGRPASPRPSSQGDGRPRRDVRVFPGDAAAQARRARRRFWVTSRAGRDVRWRGPLGAGRDLRSSPSPSRYGSRLGASRRRGRGSPLPLPRPSASIQDGGAEQRQQRRGGLALQRGHGARAAAARAGRLLRRERRRRPGHPGGGKAERRLPRVPAPSRLAGPCGPYGGRGDPRSGEAPALPLFSGGGRSAAVAGRGGSALPLRTERSGWGCLSGRRWRVVAFPALCGGGGGIARPAGRLGEGRREHRSPCCHAGSYLRAAVGAAFVGLFCNRLARAVLKRLK